MHNVSFFNMPEFEQTTWGKSCHFYSTDSVGSGYTNPLSCSGLSIDITSKNRGYSISAWEHRWAPPPEEKGGFFFFFHKLIMRRVIKTPRNTAREKLFIWNFFYDFLFFFSTFLIPTLKFIVPETSQILVFDRFTNLVEVFQCRNQSVQRG